MAKRENVSDRYITSAFGSNTTDTTMSRMLGIEVNEKPKFCSQCGCKLEGASYADPNNPTTFYCEKHYEVIASQCKGCGKAIIGFFVKGSDGSKWHQNCFNEDLPCKRCGKLVYGNEVTDPNGEKWHRDCWICSNCNLHVGTAVNQFVFHNDSVYCNDCGKNPKPPLDFNPQLKLNSQWTEVLNQRKEETEKEIFNNIQEGKETCGKCGEIIKDLNAIDLNGVLYHSACMLCSSCRKQIDGNEGYALRGNNVVCANCIKGTSNCVTCHEAISGKYLNGPSGKYHPQCFVCTSCKSTLSGGFLEKDGHPFCSSCANKPTLKMNTTITTQQKGFTIDPRTGQKKYKQ